MKKVEVDIHISVNPEQVISSFLDQNMLKVWWEVKRSFISPQPNGPYILSWSITTGGFGFVTTAIIDKIDAMSFQLSNMMYLNPEISILGPMSLEVVATPTPNGSQVYICQSGYQEGGDWDWYYEAVTNAWPIAANSLKRYLENLK